MHKSGNLSTHIPAVYDHAQPKRTYALGWLYAKPMTRKTLTNTIKSTITAEFNIIYKIL